MHTGSVCMIQYDVTTKLSLCILATRLAIICECTFVLQTYAPITCSNENYFRRPLFLLVRWVRLSNAAILKAHLTYAKLSWPSTLLGRFGRATDAVGPAHHGLGSSPIGYQSVTQSVVFDGALHVCDLSAKKLV